jgi:hypothetical protein
MTLANESHTDSFKPTNSINTEARVEYMDEATISTAPIYQENHQGTLSVTPQVIMRIAWVTYVVEVIRHCPTVRWWQPPVKM